ncbi:MAG: aspartate aminotransferase family protein [Bdellovibrionales bacterium]|nr:aspartate aminotransferase family protein [Bdellovibrionales bacterium]
MKTHLAKTYAAYPFTLASGEGPFVQDDSGKLYLDLYGGHAVSILGHQPTAVIDAINKQANTLFFYSNVAPLEVRERAADKLIAFAGGEFESVFFCNSGAEANEAALKLAMQLTGRFEIAALKGAFHGRTGIASAATDNAAWHEQLGPWFGPVTRITPNVVSELSTLSDKTAAVIVEPIQSMAGMVELNPKYLQALRETCDKHGIILIFDEVQTGVGRCGVPYLGSELVQSDMSTSAKSLASGFPVGAVLMRDTIASQITLGQLGSTFGGNPLAMAALEATLDTISSEGLVAHGYQLAEFAKQRIAAIDGVVEVRGRGCLLGIKFEADAKPIVAELRARGILIGTSDDPKVARILAPLIVEQEHFEQLAVALEEIL